MEYISKQRAKDLIGCCLASAKAEYKAAKGMFRKARFEAYMLAMRSMIDVVDSVESADVQEKKYCRMIPLEPDCRGCTDVFICTNCHQHIHLGFIRKEYSGSYCLECGAEVKDGDAE